MCKDAILRYDISFEFVLKDVISRTTKCKSALIICTMSEMHGIRLDILKSKMSTLRIQRDVALLGDNDYTIGSHLMFSDGSSFHIVGSNDDRYARGMNYHTVASTRQLPDPVLSAIIPVIQSSKEGIVFLPREV